MTALPAARLIIRGLRGRRRVDFGIRILAFHGVVERYLDSRVEESFHLLSDFRAQLAVLKKCRVVALDDLDELRKTRRIVPSVAITFDDGFANNVLAAELLEAARLPATFFVASGSIDSGQTVWPTLLRLVLARGSARRITVAGKTYDLDHDPDAFATVRKAFKQLPSAERIACWTELVEQLRDDELSALIAQFPSIAMMSWRDVASLCSSGFSVGSHGSVHELHHAAQPHQVRMHELAASKLAIERGTRRRCDSFAFPNGTFHASSSDEVRAAGYVRAFTMVSRAARGTDDSTLLPRIVATGGADRLIAKLFFGN